MKAVVDIDVKGWKWPAMQIAIARACKQRQRECDIIDASGKEADMIERRAQGMDADARDRAKTRFEADDAVKRRRPDDRAERLRTERQRHDAGGNRRGGSG